MLLSFRYTVAFFAVAFFGIAGQSQGAVTITAEETSDGLLISGSGTLNLAGMSYQGTHITGAGIRPARRVLLLGDYSLSIVAAAGYLGINGPTSFGSYGGLIYPDVSTGDRFGLTFSGTEDLTRLAVPVDYVSGTPLFGSNLYEGFSFHRFGLTPGSTYTWSLPNDTLTLRIIPEPSSVALILSACLCGVGLRRRR